MGKYVQSYRTIDIDSLKSSQFVEIEERGFINIYGYHSSGVVFSKVRVYGFVTNTYLSHDRKYGFIVVDDGTNEIRVKFFKNAEQTEKFKKGDFVVVLGRVSNYGDEIHLINEQTYVLDNLNYLTLAYVEILNTKKAFNELKKQILANKDLENEVLIKDLYDRYNLSNAELKVLVGGDVLITEKKQTTTQSADKEKIKQEILQYLQQNDNDEGIDYNEILKNMPYDSELVEQAIVDLLSEGSCYEPRPGKLKLL